ncbi:MAG TPA: DUF1848 domain-containing protein [Methanocorpusculum sp.]|nr:DUF1848 domain-containing protein [Methanocorpusculum sp.]
MITSHGFAGMGSEMIISASRRTDIPAWFSEWFCNRLCEGFCYVRNPYSQKITRVSLMREDTDVIVFWTKNAEPMMQRLSAVDASGIPYYFQYTVTPYGSDVEPGLTKRDCIKNFLELSEMLGRDRVLWRYDPVLITEKYSVEFHADAFAKLCELFSEATCRCTISFVDAYRASLFRTCTFDEMIRLAEIFSATAKRFGLPLVSCAEEIDLDRFGISHASCVDKEICESLCGRPLPVKRDRNQRTACGCVESTDIGAYGTCRCGCRYCYACGRRTAAAHDPASPLISGWPKDNEPVFPRSSGQTTLFR